MGLLLIERLLWPPLLKDWGPRLREAGRFFYLGSVWEFIREGNGMECNDHKGMERNGMEWNIFKQEKGMENNGMEWNGIK